MKILVFSDSHSCPNRLLKAVEAHHGKCDLILKKVFVDVIKLMRSSCLNAMTSP